MPLLKIGKFALVVTFFAFIFKTRRARGRLRRGGIIAMLVGVTLDIVGLALLIYGFIDGDLILKIAGSVILALGTVLQIIFMVRHRRRNRNNQDRRIRRAIQENRDVLLEGKNTRCSRCGTEADGGRFCHACGTEIVR